MTTIELFADVIQRDLEMLKSTLADFSDEDMLVRPAPAANHAAWQLGHLINSESWMVNSVKPGAIPPPPAGFTEKFKKETASNNDPAFFPRKAELLEQLSKTRAGTVAWVKTLSLSDLEKPSPEPMREWVPTVGHMVTVLPSHSSMHVGQFQVIRRKLNKPVLF